MRRNKAAAVTIAWMVAGLTISTSAAQAPLATAHAALAGVWVISPDAQLRGPDNQSAPTGSPYGRRTRGGFGGGGFGGNGGYGGRGGGGGAGREGDNPYASERQAVADFSRALMNPVRRMTISVKDPVVEVVFDDGRHLTFETTNKSVDARAENGLVKLTRKARWEGDALLAEINIENGPEFKERYEVIAEGAQLRVSISAEGSGRGDDDGKRTVTHVYERPTPN